MNTAKLKLVVGGVLIATGLGTLGFFSVQETAQYAVDVREYLARPQAFGGRGLRLSGISAKDTWQVERNLHRFDVAERTDLSQAIPVRFEGTMPDTFREGAEVIVEGKMGADGTFVATQVIPQCASKYEGVPDGFAPPDATGYPAAARPAEGPP